MGRKQNHYTQILFVFILCCLLNGCFKSKTNVVDLRCEKGNHDKWYLYNHIDLPSEKLGIEDCVWIGLHKNLALKVKEQEIKIQREIATGEKVNMLPELMSNWEWNERNNNPGSSSRSLDPTIPPAPPSVSSQRHTRTADVTLTWNLIDFGISYYIARQEVKRSEIQKLEYERLQQNLVLDIVVKYWDAITAKIGMENLKDLLERTKKRRDVIRKKIQTKTISKSKGYEMEDLLLQIQDEYEGYEKDYHFAISDLTQLMGLPPETQFELVYDPGFPINVTPDNVQHLEELALQNRPELFSHDIQEKIDADELRIAILELLPTSSLFYGYNHNSNTFLIRRDWLLVGTRAAWDLLSTPYTFYKGRIAQRQKGLTKRNRLVLSLGAITQVHLANLLYFDDCKHFELVKQQQDVKDTLLQIAKKKKKLGKLNGVELIKYEWESIQSKLNTVRTYGDIQVSLEQLNNAIGLPLFYKNKNLCYQDECKQI